ncbi:hypothetical protein M0R45_009203 [Rubus argutus]|uniref:Uncharacterized protein n=1 Tax=Rubus argutus TaxID=59490 RepID=A0AAW1Y556_RUBAR
MVTPLTKCKLRLLKLEGITRPRSKPWSRNESTTMFVDFSHVMIFNNLLQKAISDEFLRFEPHLKNAGTTPFLMMLTRTSMLLSSIFSPPRSNTSIHVML